MLTASELRAVMPNLPQAKLNAYLPHLAEAMQEAGITTRLRKAAFLAQLAHESCQLRYMQEIWGPTPAQKRYEGRRDLGNVQPGDGYRYRGRGPIQLTGRHNYRQCGRALGVDLEGNPDLASEPEYAFRIATWFWTSRGLNALADAGDFKGITRRINGGFNGLKDRQSYYRIALHACRDDVDTPIADVTVELDGQPTSEARLDDYQGKSAAWVPLKKYETPLKFTTVLAEGDSAQLMTEEGAKTLPLRIWTVNGQGVGHTPVVELRKAFKLTSEWDPDTRTVRLLRK